VTVACAGGDLADRDGVWAGLRGHEGGGALLVRPDGFVAARFAEVADPGAALAHGLGRALAADRSH
jgi:hypothetical protein